MSKEMVISANPHETRVAILEEGQLCEYYVEREKEFALVGSIYKGKVTRVLPGMQSAFVEIGLDSDAFLYVSDFLEEIEELDHVVTAVEDKTQKMEAEGGQVFPTNPGSAPIIEPVDVESSPAPALEPLAGESISGSHMPPAPFTTAPPRPSGTTSRRGSRSFRESFARPPARWRSRWPFWPSRRTPTKRWRQWRARRRPPLQSRTSFVEIRVVAAIRGSLQRTGSAGRAHFSLAARGVSREVQGEESVGSSGFEHSAVGCHGDFAF